MFVNLNDEKTHSALSCNLVKHVRDRVAYLIKGNNILNKVKTGLIKKCSYC
jgi:hypothetical protein